MTFQLPSDNVNICAVTQKMRSSKSRRTKKISIERMYALLQTKLKKSSIIKIMREP